jgi:stage II sporulation protein B
VDAYHLVDTREERISLKQEISILINGKQKDFSEHHPVDGKNEIHKEVAASYDEASIKGIVLPAAPLQKREFFLNRKPLRILPKKRTTFSFHKKGKAFSKQLIAAVMAAVLTGTVFGVLVLMVFSSDITEAENLASGTAVQKENNKGEEKLFTLPPINFEFSALQAGVFSTKERAEGAVKSIEEKGYSALILPMDGEKYSVLIGIGNEGHQLDKYKLDYEKELEKPLSKTISFSFENLKTPSNLDETYFKNGKILMQNILTLSQLPGTNAAALENTRTDFNKWKGYGEKQQGTWKKKTVQAAEAFEKNLEGAFIALKDTQKEDVNWAFQQKAMDSLESYNSLLETLK